MATRQKRVVFRHGHSQREDDGMFTQYSVNQDVVVPAEQADKWAAVGICNIEDDDVRPKKAPKQTGTAPPAPKTGTKEGAERTGEANPPPRKGVDDK